MSIPNSQFFSKITDHKPLFFGDVRSLLKEGSDESIKTLNLLLTKRLENALILPTDKIHDNKDAYVLVLMTCVGIQTIGEIFYPRSIYEYKRFTNVCDKLDELFAKPFSKEFKDGFLKMWGSDEHIAKIDSLSHLMYSMLRNKLTHGFFLKGVYMSYEDTQSHEMVINNNEAWLNLNPSWFWNTFKLAANDYLLNKAVNDDYYRNNMINYLKRITS